MIYKISVSEVAHVVKSEIALKVLSEDSNFCTSLAANPNLSSALWLKVLTACESGLVYEGIAKLAFTAQTKEQITKVIETGGGAIFSRIANDYRYPSLPPEIRGVLESNAMFATALNWIEKDLHRGGGKYGGAEGPSLSQEIQELLAKVTDNFILGEVTGRLDAIGEAGWLMFAGELPRWKESTEELLDTIETALLS